MKTLRAYAAPALLILALCITLVSGAWADDRVIPSYDRLPLGDWTYDAMISLASEGLVPGLAARVFQGDRLFDRVEMAQVLASIVEAADGRQLSTKQEALIGKLIAELRPELRMVNPGVIDKWSGFPTIVPEGEAFILGYIQGEPARDTDDDDSATVPHRISGFANLSTQTFVIGTVADRQQKFFHERPESPSPDKVLMRGIGRSSIWSIGREHLNWGPAYTGSLILSDNSPPFTQIRASKEVNFGKLFGRVKISQFATTFDDDGKMLYFFGRRYEKPLSGRWHAGISETAKLSDSPNPLILVMPFYLYQQVFDEMDEEFNSLYAADLVYQAGNGMRLYGEFVVDDMTAPKIFDDWFERPQKTGYTLGFHAPRVLGGRRPADLRAEYIYIRRPTYEATRPSVPELAYTHNGDIIGHPIGPNSKALYLRGEKYLSDRLSMIAEYLNQQQTASGEPERGRRRVVSLLTAYDISSGKSVAFRIAPYKVTEPGEPADDGTEYELRASFAF